MLACMAVALSGFLSFGDKTMGNVLVSLVGLVLCWELIDPE